MMHEPIARNYTSSGYVAVVRTCESLFDETNERQPRPCVSIEPPLSTDISPFSKGENPGTERGLSKKASSNRL